MNDSDRDCSALEAQVRRATKGRPLREFMKQTPGCVSYSVLFKMAHGRHVVPVQLHKWATAIGEDPDDWYIWGGYPEMARKPAAEATDHSSPNTGVTKSPGQPGHLHHRDINAHNGPPVT